MLYTCNKISGTSQKFLKCGIISTYVEFWLEKTYKQIKNKFKIKL